MNTLQLYTWNVLSSNKYVNIMTWKKCSGAKQLSKLDYARSKHRQNIQLQIIIHWLKDINVIICLQEVDKQLLEKLLHLTNVEVFYTKHKKFFEKESQLVTLVKGYSCTNIEIDIHDRSIMKTTLNNDTDIFNVHLYWKWDILEINKIAKLIENTCQVKFIICGDMNKTRDELYEFLEIIPCIHLFNEKGYTSIFNLKKLYIDHIFVSSSLKPIKDPKLIRKMGKYKLLYNIEKICSLFNANRLTLNNWINKRKYNDISDHIPIYIRINN